MDIQQWLLFIAITFVATATPGPAILLATSHSLSYGLKNTIFTILGNITGLFFMSLLAVVGLSTIILGSVVLFSIVKFIGALYLIYLGIKMWRNGFSQISKPNKCQQKLTSRKKLYLQGLFVALGNPKAIAFTTALFPQFIVAGNDLVVQFSVLVSIFMILSFVCIFSYAYMVQSAKNKFFGSTSNYVSKIFGTGFIVSGIALANVTHK